MIRSPSDDLITFTPDTKAAFLQHLRENPNNRRVSPSDKEILVEWLTNQHKRPSSQEEFSRRNYVRKAFAWDVKSQNLLAVAKKDGDKDRTVITTDVIAEVVETVHENNGHAGWDTTWKDVSTSYYGILRSDVIFLLKKCRSCVGNPSKRPKGSTAAKLHSRHSDHEFFDVLNADSVKYDDFAVDGQENNGGKFRPHN
jgi:hypothetical protein